jgi:hypothetical protein
MATTIFSKYGAPAGTGKPHNTEVIIKYGTPGTGKPHNTYLSMACQSITLAATFKYDMTD